MIVKVLDRKTMGYDIPLTELERFGALELYDSTEPDVVKQRCADAEVIVLNKIKITKDIMLEAKKLKLICVFATGYDNIDISAARELGIAVCNVPAYSTDSVALFTVATVLSLCTRLKEYTEYVSSGRYTASGSPNYITPVYNDLRGKVWGIVGLGNIGKAVAKVAVAFGASVIANKRAPDDEYECVGLRELCERSDIITVHTPLTDETRGMINREMISYMKKSVILVNEARGAVLNESDVAQAVIDGRIAYFGCDVFSTEPFGEEHPYNKIKEMPNVILTPHTAWSSYESRVRCVNVICENISAFKNNKILNRVDILRQS